MKKYVSPELDVELFSVADMIMESAGDPTMGNQNQSGPDDITNIPGLQP